jgi:hypothetical protein
MRIDFGRLRVSRLIVHEVPGKLQNSNQQPTLSTVETELSEDEKNYFAYKIKENLITASFEARFMPDAESPIPKLVFDNFSNSNDNFVEMSREMAKYLFECQTRVNSAGLLAVIEVSIAEQRALAILKLEKEEGMSIEINKNNGEITFDVKYISNILLSERNRVFKTGLFVAEGESIDEIDVHISDNQSSQGSSPKIATFFLEKFLGCKLKENPNIITQKFFEKTEFFINEQVEDAEEKSDYHMALISELKSGDNIINPENFCDKYIRKDQKQKYLKYLESVNMSTRPFLKNTELIDKKLKKVQMDFESGASIQATPEFFRNQMHIVSQGDGQTHIEFEDKLKQIKGK